MLQDMNRLNLDIARASSNDGRRDAQNLTTDARTEKFARTQQNQRAERVAFYRPETMVTASVLPAQRSTDVGMRLTNERDSTKRKEKKIGNGRGKKRREEERREEKRRKEKNREEKRSNAFRLSLRYSVVYRQAFQSRQIVVVDYKRKVLTILLPLGARSATFSRSSYNDPSEREVSS